MSAAPRIDVKGWCPGALRPMESGDGLVVRVRPKTGAFSLADWTLLCGAAAGFGNSHLDLTRRANLQIRGVTANTLPPLLAWLGAAGLIDDSAAAEAVRNVMLPPLAGLDAAEVADLRPLAAALARSLAGSPDLHGLAGKFGFVLDAGGVATMHDERADIRLRALDRSTLAAGFDTADETLWLGAAPMESGAEVAAGLARLFLATAATAEAGRIRHLSGERLQSLVAAARLQLAPLPGMSVEGKAGATHPIGAVSGQSGIWVAGVGVPFGQLAVAELDALITAASDAGASEIRLSPWRILYVPCASRAAADVVLERAGRLGLPTAPDAPVLHFEACPGAPWCRSAAAETRSVARSLASSWPADLGRVSVHVSGCRKGCAAPRRASLTLVAEDAGFAVIANGRASDPPLAYIGGPELAADPARLFSILVGAGHV